MTIRTEVDDDHIILSSSQQLYFCGSSTTLYADAEDDDGDDGDSYSDGEDGCFDPLHTSWLLAHFYADEPALQLSAFPAVHFFLAFKAALCSACHYCC